LKKIAVFISGRGSNLAALIDAINTGALQAEIALVVSHTEKSGGLQLARSAGIPTVITQEGPASALTQNGQILVERLQAAEIDWIVLAGFIKKLPESIIDFYYPRLVNIHPALLPAFGGKGFYGMRIHQSVIERGVFYSGLTIHLVNKDYDAGPIVFQKIVNVEEDDNAERLAERILREEHRYYALVIQRLLYQSFIIRNKRIFFQ